MTPPIQAGGVNIYNIGSIVTKTYSVAYVEDRGGYCDGISILVDGEFVDLPRDGEHYDFEIPNEDDIVTIKYTADENVYENMNFWFDAYPTGVEYFTFNGEDVLNGYKIVNVEYYEWPFELVTDNN